MGTAKYIREVVYNDECHWCGGPIDMSRRQQRFQRYCCKVHGQSMWQWCKREGLLEYYKGPKTRFALNREFKRY